MPTYKILGSRTQEFYIDVAADDPDEAYDRAQEDHVQWFEIETDDPIEPYEVRLIESAESGRLEYNQDEEYPSMEPGILIEGKE